MSIVNYKIKVVRVQSMRYTQEMQDDFILLGINELENPISVSLSDFPDCKAEWNWHTKTLEIETLAGSSVVSVGDYIIRNDKGVFSVYNPENFFAIYEEDIDIPNAPNLCKIYGCEKAEWFVTHCTLDALESVCQDLWDNPNQYNKKVENKSEEAFYDFLKYLWVKYPDGREEKRVCDIAKM